MKTPFVVLAGSYYLYAANPRDYYKGTYPCGVSALNVALNSGADWWQIIDVRANCVVRTSEDRLGE